MPDLGKIEKQQPEDHFDQLEDTTHRFVVIIVVYLLLLTVIVANYLFNPFQLNCDLLTMFTFYTIRHETTGHPNAPDNYFKF